MSTDGLLPQKLSALHARYRTPYKANIIVFILVGLFAAFLPGNITGDLTSIGTLFAFVVVCIGIWIMRKNNPHAPRGFKTPFVPLVPILGMLVCGTMILSLDRNTLLTAFVWMCVGLVVYFSYSIKRSKLR